MYRKIMQSSLARGATIIVAVLVLTGCGIASKTKDELFKEGLEQMKEKNYNGAVVLFRTALEKDQNFFEARLQLAQAYMKTGKYEKAEKEFQKVSLQNPSNKGIYKELAQIYISLNKPDIALENAHRYVEDEFGDSEIYEIMGYAYAQKKAYPEAEKHFTKSLQAEPERISAKIGLARVYMENQNYQGVRTLLNEVLDKDAQNKQAYYLLASLEESSGERVKALQMYEKISEIDPSDINARFKVGVSHLEKREFEKAAKIAEEIIRKAPNRSEGYRLQGLMNYFNKNYDQAIVAFQQSLRMQPNVGSYYFLGLSHFSKGELEQALSQFQRSLDIYPQFAQARLMLTVIFLRQGRLDDSIKEARRIIQQDENNALAHNLLGSALLGKELYDEAMKEFDTALELDPGLIDVHLKKGLFSLGKGKTDDAETELKNAVEIAPDLLNARILLVSYYLRNKEFDKAVQTLKEGLKGNKNDAVLYNYMAAAYFSQKKADSGLTTLEKAKESNPDYYTPYYNLANYHTLKGSYDKALDEYQAVLARDTQNIRALIGSAIIFELQGKDEEALSYYTKAKNTKNSAGYIALANYWLKKNDDSKAIDVLTEGIKTNPGEITVREVKGQIYLKNRNYKEAIRVFQEIDSIDHNKSLALLINTHYLARDYKEALRIVERELRINTDRLDLMGEVSRIYLLMGDNYQAIANADKIIQKKPDSAYGYTILALVYDSQNKIDDAINTLKKGIKVDGNNLQARMMLGGFYQKKNDYKLALETYADISKSVPRYIPSIFAEGTIYDLTGKKKEAIKKYQEVLAKADNYIPALNNLSYLYIEGYGSKEEALDYAIKAYRLAPSNASVIDTLGYALLKNGRFDEAIKVLESAVKLLPDNPTVNYHLAVAYKEKGNIGDARKHLETALSKNDFPEAGQAHKMLKELKNK